MLALWLLCLLCCCIDSSLGSGNVTEPEAIAAGATTSGVNASLAPSPHFVTSLSVRGCPVFVHRLGASGRSADFALEPVFCIILPESLTQASVRFDPLTNQSYFSFPVVVTDKLILSEAESQLRSLSPSSLAFVDIADVRLASDTGGVVGKAWKFVWDPTESTGYLRVVCNGLACQSIALHLWSGQFELLDNINLVATIVFNKSRSSTIERTYPVTIAHTPFLPVEMMQRPRKLPSCSDLRLVRAIQLDNCTAYVYRWSKTSQFIIEPLLCPSESHYLLTDYSLGQHYLKIPATVQDAAVIDRVRSRLASESPDSIIFMKLWSATIHATSSLSQWKIGPLRLSADRSSAELRVYCSKQASCELLSSVLNSEPVNFWMNLQWTATSVMADKCEFKSSQSRFAFRMRDRMRKITDLPVSPATQWSADTLCKKRVVRDGRPFVIVQQRGCEQSHFQRYWKAYANGFGDDANFWIGLEALHSLTNPQGATMRVEMRLWNGTEWFGEYSGFIVGNSSTNYRMNYTQMVRTRSSLVYDALKSSKGFPFSTRDRKNYRYTRRYGQSSSCSSTAGWWFPSCTKASPNGVYHHGDSSSTDYAVWRFVHVYKTVKEFRMMLQL